MGWKYTHENVWERYAAEKPPFAVYEYNMGLLVSASGLSTDAYYRKYGHQMGTQTLLTPEDASRMQAQKEVNEIHRELEDKIRIGKAVTELEKPEWQKERMESDIASQMKDYDKGAGLGASKVGTIAHLPIVLVAIAIGVLIYFLGRGK